MSRMLRPKRANARRNAQIEQQNNNEIEDAQDNNEIIIEEAQTEQQNNNETTDEDTKSNIERVSPPPKAPREQDPAPRRIWLQFVGNSQHWGRHGNQEMYVNVDARLKYYMERYANGIGQSRQYLRFFGPEGERLDAEKTVEKNGLEDGDQIDVFEWQVGGDN